MTKCEILLEKATKVTTKERDQVKDTKFYYKSANTVKYDMFFCGDREDDQHRQRWMQ